MIKARHIYTPSTRTHPIYICRKCMGSLLLSLSMLTGELSPFLSLNRTHTHTHAHTRTSSFAFSQSLPWFSLCKCILAPPSYQTMTPNVSASKNILPSFFSFTSRICFFFHFLSLFKKISTRYFLAKKSNCR